MLKENYNVLVLRPVETSISCNQVERPLFFGAIHYSMPDLSLLSRRRCGFS